MKSGSSHIATGSHGSPQCLFFCHNGTYDGVTDAGGTASSIGSYSGCCGVCVVVVLVVVGIGGVGCVGSCSSSSIPSSVSSSVTVSRTGAPPPPCIHHGAIASLVRVGCTRAIELGVIPTLGLDLGMVLGVTPTSDVDLGTVLGVITKLGLYLDTVLGMM